MPHPFHIINSKFAFRDRPRRLGGLPPLQPDRPRHRPDPGQAPPGDGTVATTTRWAGITSACRRPMPHIRIRLSSTGTTRMSSRLTTSTPRSGRDAGRAVRHTV